MFSFFVFKCILRICVALWYWFLHDVAITCSICPIMSLNVTVDIARLGLEPGFRATISMVTKVLVRVSVSVTNRL